MYLVCPWFFLVIYLAFLMLDVWDRLQVSVLVSVEGWERRRGVAIDKCP